MLYEVQKTHIRCMNYSGACVRHMFDVGSIKIYYQAQFLHETGAFILAIDPKISVASPYSIYNKLFVNANETYKVTNYDIVITNPEDVIDKITNYNDTLKELLEIDHFRKKGMQEIDKQRKMIYELEKQYKQKMKREEEKRKEESLLKARAFFKLQKNIKKYDSINQFEKAFSLVALNENRFVSKNNVLIVEVLEMSNRSADHIYDLMQYRNTVYDNYLSEINNKLFIVKESIDLICEYTNNIDIIYKYAPDSSKSIVKKNVSENYYIIITTIKIDNDIYVYSNYAEKLFCIRKGVYTHTSEEINHNPMPMFYCEDFKDWLG